MEQTLRQAETAEVEPFSDLPFDEFCARYLRVQTKSGEIAPLQLKRAQRELIANLTGRDLVLKARQVGISTGIQALHFQQQMKGNARTNTLCHEDDLTHTLRRMADRFYSDLPESAQPERKYANAKLTTYSRLNSESSIATVGGTAGARKGRGGSMTRIHGSEVALWPDARAVMAAAMQAGDPDIILESTANGMSGPFYEWCMEALAGNSIWTLHFFPWWYDDDYRIALDANEAIECTSEEQLLVDGHGLDAEQIKWRRRKIQELPHTFKQEYPEDPYSCFLSSGTSFFGDVEHVYTAPMDAEPIEDRRYVIGLDFGQTIDYTVGFVLDTVTLQQVDLLHVNNQSWSDMRRLIADLSHKWNEALVIAEQNSMGANIEELRKEGVNLTVFNTTAQSKPPLIQGYRYALSEGGLTLLDVSVLRHEIRAFISKQLPSGAWQYKAQEGAHDDTVIAGALAWHGMNIPTRLVDFI